MPDAPKKSMPGNTKEIRDEIVKAERKHRQPGAAIEYFEPIYACWTNMGNGKRRRGHLPSGNH